VVLLRAGPRHLALLFPAGRGSPRPWTGGGTSVGEVGHPEGGGFREDLHRPHLGSGQAPDLFGALGVPVYHPEYAPEIVEDVGDLLSLRAAASPSCEKTSSWRRSVVTIVTQMICMITSRGNHRTATGTAFRGRCPGPVAVPPHAPVDRRRDRRGLGRSCSTVFSGGRSTPFSKRSPGTRSRGRDLPPRRSSRSPRSDLLVFLIPALGGLVSG